MKDDPKDADIKFDNFEIVYKLGDKVVGRYKTSEWTGGPSGTATQRYTPTWDQRMQLDHDIADVVEGCQHVWEEDEESSDNGN